MAYPLQYHISLSQDSSRESLFPSLNSFCCWKLKDASGRCIHYFRGPCRLCSRFYLYLARVGRSLVDVVAGHGSRDYATAHLFVCQVSEVHQGSFIFTRPDITIHIESQEWTRSATQ